MLPFTKRPARSQDSSSEAIHTGEIEIVRGPVARAQAAPPSVRGPQVKTPSRFPPPPSERPRVFQRSMSDEDKTLMMPVKPRISSAPPPAFAASHQPVARTVPAPNLRGLVRQKMDEERTILRPSAAPAATKPASQAPAMLPTPYMPFKPPMAAKVPSDLMPKSAPPPLPMKPASKGSDPRIDPPAAVITARTKIAPKRSNLSWAAALMAGGVFVGLVTAVLARGDGDALIDATASFVDPSRVAARPVAAAAVGTPVVTLPAAMKEAPVAKVDVKKDVVASCLSTPEPSHPVANTPPPKTEPAPIAATPVAVAAASPSPIALQPRPVDASKPEPPKPAPIAYAAPPSKPVVAHVAPPPPPARPAYTLPVAAVAAAPKPAAPPPPVAAARPAAPSSARDDFATAAAADALAKAQLEASLR